MTTRQTPVSRPAANLDGLGPHRLGSPIDATSEPFWNQTTPLEPLRLEHERLVLLRPDGPQLGRDVAVLLLEPPEFGPLQARPTEDLTLSHTPTAFFVDIVCCCGVCGEFIYSAAAATTRDPRRNGARTEHLCEGDLERLVNVGRRLAARAKTRAPRDQRTIQVIAPGLVIVDPPAFASHPPASGLVGDRRAALSQGDQPIDRPPLLGQAAREAPDGAAIRASAQHFGAFARQHHLELGSESLRDVAMTQVLTQLFREGSGIYSSRTALFGYAYSASLNLRTCRG